MSDDVTTPNASALDSCHCCEQTDAVGANRQIFNPAGLSALDYRTGVYGSFKNDMIRRLPLFDLNAAPEPPNRPLSQLTTRDPADPTLGLLDAWASALDVLTFYQERIANEGFLRTATERRSVLELAREVGYELAPGLAATVDLSFTVETAAGTPHEADVEIGTKVMSVPGQNEKPQIFETIEPVHVRTDWNQLTAAPSIADPLPPIPQGKLIGNFAYFDLKSPVGKGDSLLFDPVAGAIPVMRFVKSVELSAETNSQLVTWDGDAIDPLNPATDVHVLRHKAALFAHNAPDWRTLPDQIRQNFPPQSPVNPDPGDFTAKYPPLKIDTFNPKILKDSFVVLQSGTAQQLFSVDTAAATTHADFALAQRGTALTLNPPIADIPNFHLTFPVRKTAVHAESEKIKLGFKPAPPRTTPDRQFPQPSATSPTAADKPRRSLLLKDAPPAVALLEVGRRITVFGKRVRVQALQDEQVPVPRFRKGDQFILLEQVQPLSSQNPDGSLTTRFRWLLQRPSGEQLEFLAGAVDGPTFNMRNSLDTTPAFTASVLAAADDDAAVGETLQLEAVEKSGEAPDTAAPADTLVFTDLPRRVYDRGSLSAFANVVRATHGETVANEVLGSGTAIPNLTFALKRKPLTFVSSAASPTGVDSALTVRVNDVEWSEVPSLFGLGPRKRSYTVRIDDTAQPTIMFGDGIAGAQPPTGVENIVATYRTGLGTDGMVKANQLSLLVTRPIGVRSVTNPLPAFDGVAPATLDQARTNTPLNVRSTGRVVTVLDAEDFARTFAGIGNAQATLLGVGKSRIIHLTVAGTNGDPIAADSPLLDTLQRAIEQSADPSLHVVIDTFEPVPFVLSVNVLVDPDFEEDKVKAAAKDVLVNAFAVIARPFGELITEAEILSLVQGVEGVTAAQVVDFRKEGDNPLNQTTALQALPAHLSGGATGVVIRAEVLVLALGNPTIGSMNP